MFRPCRAAFAPVRVVANTAISAAPAKGARSNRTPCCLAISNPALAKSPCDRRKFLAPTLQEPRQRLTNGLATRIISQMVAVCSRIRNPANVAAAPIGPAPNGMTRSGATILTNASATPHHAYLS